MELPSVHIDELIFRHLQGSLTEAEQQELAEWLQTAPARQAFFDQLTDPDRLTRKLRFYAESDEAGALQEATLHLFGASHRPARQVHFLRKWWWAAASIVVLLGVGAYLWLDNLREPSTELVNHQMPEAITPGKNGAILTLADGSQVVLDSLGNGVVAQQNGAQAVLQNGQLHYDPTNAAQGVVVYNTMSTPKGRQFQVTLPDGTRAWLNAASSIRYPTVFTGATRTVSIKGEVYFEIAANAKQPFIVAVNDQTQIQVLGTSFNVNAYDNEPGINTTLLQGLVRVASGTDHYLLRPGEQAQVQPNNIRIVKADTDKVMAWKNGLFNFRNASLAEIMRQLERWYDIEVVYEQSIPNVTLMGKLSRDVTLIGLLKNLRQLGLHTRLDGRTLVVLPN